MDSILSGLTFSSGLRTGKEVPWIQIIVLLFLLIGFIVLLVVLTKPTSTETSTEEPTGSPEAVQSKPIQPSVSGTSMSTKTL